MLKLRFFQKRFYLFIYLFIYLESGERRGKEMDGNIDV